MHRLTPQQCTSLAQLVSETRAEACEAEAPETAAVWEARRTELAAELDAAVEAEDYFRAAALTTAIASTSRMRSSAARLAGGGLARASAFVSEYAEQVCKEERAAVFTVCFAQCGREEI